MPAWLDLPASQQLPAATDGPQQGRGDGAGPSCRPQQAGIWGCPLGAAHGQGGSREGHPHPAKPLPLPQSTSSTRRAWAYSGWRALWASNMPHMDAK